MAIDERVLRDREAADPAGDDRDLCPDVEPPWTWGQWFGDLFARARITTAAVGDVDRRWASALLVAWAVLFVVSGAVEPAPADPTVADPWYATALAASLGAALLATVFGLASRRRFGLIASAATAGLFAVTVVACPVTGHHAIGWWWGVQAAAAATLVGMSAVALRRV